MPILEREADCFPDDLFEDHTFWRPGHAWWALYTLARREKELVRRLRAERITCYCPQIVHRRRSPAGRVRMSHLPLFGGYVFAYGEESQRYSAMTTNCVSRCLPVANGEELFRDLNQIWRLIQSGVPLTPEERLAPGQRITVRRGALAGMEGTILQRRGGNRLIVAVNFLQRGVSVLLEDTDLVAI